MLTPIPFIVVYFFASSCGSFVPADPIASPSSVILLGDDVRLTLLSPSFLRLEASLSPTANRLETPHGYDDRATLAVVNRRTPPPTFSVTHPDSNTTIVTTAVLQVTHVRDGRSSGSCSGAFPGTDAARSTRSPTYPKGIANSTRISCCAACDGDARCVAWVLEGGGNSVCFPLSAFAGTRAAANRTFSEWVAPRVTVAFAGPEGSQVKWVPRAAAPGNLNGTYLSLDSSMRSSSPMQALDDYAARMGEGLVSRDGWAALDDTGTARTAPTTDAPAGLPFWLSADARIDALDVYLHVHADLDYRGALAAWAGVLGNAALIPRAAFGVWWSRYYPYTDATLVSEVLQGYADYRIPLDWLVLDDDWHNKPTDKACSTWGNYDVNVTDFPAFADFVAGLHAHGNVTGTPLRLSLNLHPETGVDACNARYVEVARAVGVDPSTNETIACDFGNARFVDALARVYLDAAPLGAVDVWWTDWSGCGASGGNPLLWANIAFFEHTRSRGVRGQAFSRFGGVGNHRAPHGFSGDTFQHEATLKYQVKTTQTASNVLFGYWSHDIGGFHGGNGAPGDADPTNTTGAELLLRWIQFGAVAPILRTHCDHCERRIWVFPYFELMRDAMRLRAAFVPYLYTEARAFYDTGIAPIHPIYYDSPHDAAVYKAPVVERQYMFGDRVLSQPVTTMTGIVNGSLVGWDTYLPGGAWSNWDGTHVSTGPATVSGVVYGLGDIPLFVRGGILPLASPPATGDGSSSTFPGVAWALFPGTASGSYTLYEDDGSSDAYIGGEAVTTVASFEASPVAATLTVRAAVAAAALPPGYPATRAVTMQVRGVAASGRAVASVSANGVTVPPGAGTPGWRVVGAAEHSLVAPAGALVVDAGVFSAWSDVVVEVTFA